jgi:hypothetical protein
MTAPMPTTLPFVTMLVRLLTLCPIILALGACSAIGELAYDSAAGFERQRCDRLESAPERQACQDKVRAATRQAEESRKKL